MDKGRKAAVLQGVREWLAIDDDSPGMNWGVSPAWKRATADGIDVLHALTWRFAHSAREIHLAVSGDESRDLQESLKRLASLFRLADDLASPAIATEFTRSWIDLGAKPLVFRDVNHASAHAAAAAVGYRIVTDLVSSLLSSSNDQRLLDTSPLEWLLKRVADSDCWLTRIVPLQGSEPNFLESLLSCDLEQEYQVTIVRLTRAEVPVPIRAAPASRRGRGRPPKERQCLRDFMADHAAEGDKEIARLHSAECKPCRDDSINAQTVRDLKRRGQK